MSGCPMAANASYESTTPVGATLGGYSGKRVDLQLAPDPSGCDNFEGEENQYFVFGGRDGGMYAQGGANRWQVTIVDVEGTRLIAVLMAYEETSAADLAPPRASSSRSSSRPNHLAARLAVTAGPGWMDAAATAVEQTMDSVQIGP